MKAPNGKPLRILKGTFNGTRTETPKCLGFLKGSLQRNPVAIMQAPKVG